jgi:hypothetical protein
MVVAALCGRAKDLQPSLAGLSTYWEHYAAWADAVYRWCAESIGYVEGEAFHLWHGNWRDRQYESRLARLRGFEPDIDLAPTAGSGLAEWTPSAYASKPDLVHAVELYFGARLEDAPLS